MARKRMIDPSFWEDPTIGSLSVPARLLFIGMMSHADDEGRIEVEPRYIRRAVFGFDEDVTAGLVVCYLTEIRELCRSVQFYEVDGRSLAYFINWKRYQYIQKPQASKLPAPPETTPIVPVPDDYDSGNVPVPPNRIEKNRIEKNGDGMRVREKLTRIFASSEQAEIAIAAAVPRGGFTLADVELCERWLDVQRPEWSGKVGSLYKTLKTGDLPVLPRVNSSRSTNGIRTGPAMSEAPDYDETEAKRRSAAYDAKHPNVLPVGL